MSRQSVSPAIEEYLESIFRLQEKNGVARTSEIVRSLNVSPGTVSNTLESLKKKGYVMWEPYKGVKLTDKGRNIAIKVIRKHRLCERLITDFLKMDWSCSHEAACRLEHCFTNEMTNYLEKALRNPKTCPHGNPIPTHDDRIRKEETVSLCKLKTNDKAVITRIIEEEREILNYFSKQGLYPGVKVRLMEKTPLDGPILIEANGNKVALSIRLASIIHVKKL